MKPDVKEDAIDSINTRKVATFMVDETRFCGATKQEHRKRMSKSSEEFLRPLFVKDPKIFSLRPFHSDPRLQTRFISVVQTRPPPRDRNADKPTKKSLIQAF